MIRNDIILMIFMIPIFKIFKIFNLDDNTSVLLSLAIIFTFGILLTIISRIIMLKYMRKIKDENDARKTLKIINFLKEIAISDAALNEIYMKRAALYSFLGDYSNALKSLSLVKLKENSLSIVNFDYYIGLACCHMCQGNLNECELDIINAEKIYSNTKHGKLSDRFNIEILTKKVELKIIKGENDDQLDELLKSISVLQSKYPKINILNNMMMAKIYILKNKYDIAEKYITLVKSSTDRVLVLDEVKRLETQLRELKQ